MACHSDAPAGYVTVLAGGALGRSVVQVHAHLRGRTGILVYLYVDQGGLSRARAWDAGHAKNKRVNLGP